MNKYIRMENITKRFPGVTASEKVTVEFEKGEIHALLGENGAGKTTLMNMLYGLLKPDEGKIFINDKEVFINNPKDAINNGIGMVHQHFMLIPKFTVLENIVLGTKFEREPLIDLASARKRIMEISESTGLKINPDKKVLDLCVGDQQRVEIIKALYKGAKVLIMDEPTSVLTAQEADELFAVLRRWTKEGNTAIFITHKMREVMEVCDRISILRDGACIATVNTVDTDADSIAKMMVGRDISQIVNISNTKVGKEILQVKNLYVKNDRGILAVNGLSLQVKEGEILGIAGVDGNGQLELIESIMGLMHAEEGEIVLENKSIKGLSTDKILKLGISNIPFRRQSEGLALEFSIRDNYILKERWEEPFSKKGFLQNKVIYEKVKEVIEHFGIKANGPETKVCNMSGGNQQKVVIAREINRSPKLLIACHPTHGLDIGAIEFIHNKLIQQREKGTAILLVSTELDELLSLSDRILVLFKGEVMGEVIPSQKEVEKIGLMMLGKKIIS